MFAIRNHLDLAVEDAARRPLVGRFRIFFGLENGDAVFVGIRFGERLRARAGRPYAVTTLSVLLLVDRRPSTNEDVSGLPLRFRKNVVSVGRNKEKAVKVIHAERL